MRCGDALDQPVYQPGHPGDAPPLCRACRLSPPPFERAVAFAAYQGRMRSAIHALKYDRIPPAARPMGAMLAQAIAALYSQAPSDLLVVPVPLHRRRRVERGFNQSRLLALHALRALRKSHPDWHLQLAPRTLMRLKATESQTGLTPRQRRLNVRAAFKVSDVQIIRGRHVLLVDDILTTGATARAAAQTLLRAGAASVWVATLARTRRAGIDTSFANPFSSSLSNHQNLAGEIVAPANQGPAASVSSSTYQPSS